MAMERIEGLDLPHGVHLGLDLPHGVHLNLILTEILYAWLL
jgi:hypothetical protein